MRLTPQELRTLARVGAELELTRLVQEQTAITHKIGHIRAMFPDLPDGNGTHPTPPATPQRSSRRKQARMSAAARKAVSVRMKKYWRDRRKEKAAA